jgi:TMEM175 potassium channel family protein
MPSSGDLFEMRRLEDLSNTIFGVAMTLLAYRFPTGQLVDGTPVWSTIWSTYQSQIVAVLLSFVVAGMFWISHQRRLAYAPLASRFVVYLNLLFLLFIIALPITTGLYGTYGNARDIVVLYSCHMAAIATLNALLWFLAALPRGEPERLVAPAFATAVFVAATLVALVAPQTYIAPLMWFGAFASPVVEAIRARRRRG